MLECFAIPRNTKVEFSHTYEYLGILRSAWDHLRISSGMLRIPVQYSGSTVSKCEGYNLCRFSFVSMYLRILVINLELFLTAWKVSELGILRILLGYLSILRDTLGHLVVLRNACIVCITKGYSGALGNSQECLGTPRYVLGFFTNTQ